MVGKAEGTAEIRKLYVQKLKSSGLTEKHGKTLKLQTLTASATQGLHKSFARVPSIRIGYFDPHGKPTRFYRLRYLKTPPGFQGQAEKKRRYVQAPDSLNEVYLPPLLERPWTEILKDPKTPIIITEGELKAAAGCARGFTVLSVGGVDVFRSKKHPFPNLLPVLDEAEWNMREVFIVWDSDVAVKPGPIAAQRELAYRLAKRGALPKLLGIPGGVEAKVGLDDWLLEHTNEELQELLKGAEPYRLADELWGLNSEVVLIKQNAIVIAHTNPDGSEREELLYMTPERFQTVLYANRTVLVEDKKRPLTLASEWIRWPRRAEVEKLAYRPGEPRIVDGKWNAWRRWGVESKEGDVKPFLRLVDFLFKRESREAMEWFLRWLAYPLQHPGAKLFTACLFWGVEGSGKTFVGEFMRDIYGPLNSSKINGTQLHSQFNSWAWNKQFILAEEVTGSDKRADADHLKTLITQETVTINEKYLPEITLPDCANYYLTSNHANALYLGDMDRRYFVNHVTDKESDAFYKEIDTWRRQGGAAHLRHFLEHLDLADFNPKAKAFVTADKEDMIADSRSEIARWVFELRSNPRDSLGGLANARALDGCDLFTPTQLYQCFNPEDDRRKGTMNGLARELRSANVFKANYGDKIKCPRSKRTEVFYILRNDAKWLKASPQACAEHWEQFFTGAKHEK